MGAVKLALLAICVLAGCDDLFNLEPIDPSDAGAQLDAAEACPADYVTVTNAPVTSSYRYVSLEQIWEVAEADCVNDSLTDITHLAVLEDVPEMAALHVFVETQAGGSYFRTLVGHARNVGEDPLQFYAVTGEKTPRSHPPWAANEPDNEPPSGIGEETIVWFETNLDLIDGPETLPQTYICECDHRPVTRQFVLR